MAGDEDLKGSKNRVMYQRGREEAMVENLAWKKTAEIAAEEERKAVREWAEKNWQGEIFGENGYIYVRDLLSFLDKR